MTTIYDDIIYIYLLKSSPNKKEVSRNEHLILLINIKNIATKYYSFGITNAPTIYATNPTP